MALFGLVFVMVALVLVGVGFAIGLVACAVAGALLGLGVLSSSVVIGVRSGRPAAGIRAFLIQCGILAGAPAGAVCAVLAQSFFAAYGEGWPVIVYGALGGVLAGLIVALLLDFGSRRLQAWASSRFTAMGGSASPAIERGA